MGFFLLIFCIFLTQTFKKATLKMGKKRYTKEEKLDAFKRFFLEQQLPFTPSEFKGNMLSKFDPALAPVRMPKQIKELLELLESEGHLESDKIGSSTYYWSFPASLSNKKKRKLSELQGEHEENVQKKRKISHEIVELKKFRVEGNERTEKLTLRKERKKLVSELDQELETLKEFDPEIMEELQQNCQKAKEGMERWTDNCYQLQKEMENKNQGDPSQVKKFLGMNDAFDDAFDQIEKESNRIKTGKPKRGSKKK